MSRFVPRGMFQGIVFGVIFLLLPGCSGRLTTSNYDRIETGMTEAAVTSILGPGKEEASSNIDIPGQSMTIPGAGSVSVSGISSSAKVISWEEPGRVITVTFQDGKVAGKAQAGL